MRRGNPPGQSLRHFVGDLLSRSYTFPRGEGGSAKPSRKRNAGGNLKASTTLRLLPCFTLCRSSPVSLSADTLPPGEGMQTSDARPYLHIFHFPVVTKNLPQLVVAA